MWIILAFSGGYILFVLIILFGLFRFKQPNHFRSNEVKEVSLIVPFRNEEKRIQNLLDSLLKIQYPLDSLHIIFVNDHSEDASADIVSQFILKNRFKANLFDLPDGLEGKKAALEYALIHAVGDYTFFTDADCTLPPLWIQTMLKEAILKDADMLGGAVVMTGKSSVAHFQMAEFVSLQAVTLGSAAYNKAVLSNAANMCVKTDVLKALDDPFLRDVSSGDDVFLMDKLQKQSSKVAFCLHPYAVVQTPASESMSELMWQRARWLSKVKKYRLNFSMFVAGLFAGLQFAYLVVFVFLIASAQWLILLAFVMNKIIFDQVLLLQTAQTLKAEKHIFSYLFLSLIYPLWTIFSSIASFIIQPKWKGRKLEV